MHIAVTKVVFLQLTAIQGSSVGRRATAMSCSLLTPLVELLHTVPEMSTHAVRADFLTAVAALLHPSSPLASKADAKVPAAEASNLFLMPKALSVASTPVTISH